MGKKGTSNKTSDWGFHCCKFLTFQEGSNDAGGTVKRITV